MSKYILKVRDAFNQKKSIYTHTHIHIYDYSLPILLYKIITSMCAVSLALEVWKHACGTI